MTEKLKLGGRRAGMDGGIMQSIASINLISSIGGIISTASVSASDFTVNASTGELSNSTAIDFEIVADDIGKVASYGSLIGISDLSVMLTIDLTTPITLQTAGTATFAIGAFKGTL